jgi:hypothetical protein
MSDARSVNIAFFFCLNTRADVRYKTEQIHWSSGPWGVNTLAFHLGVVRRYSASIIFLWVITESKILNSVSLLEHSFLVRILLAGD